MDKRQLFIVEDEKTLQQMMRDMLDMEGYEATVFDCGSAALDVLKTNQPALVLLDVGLPDMSGVEVCRTLREFSSVPVIMVTGKCEISDKIEGFKAGADDYLTKPFSYAELIARIEAIIRRTEGTMAKTGQRCFQCGDLNIDLDKHVVTVNNEVVDLSTTQYKMLTYLASKIDTVISPQELLTKVWGEEYKNYQHLIQVNVCRLRSKLGDDSRDFKYIETVVGEGYKLNSK